MDMQARIRLTIMVPFKADIPIAADPKRPTDNEAQAATSARIEAAKYAETTLIDNLKKSIKFDVVDELIEEVSEVTP